MLQAEFAFFVRSWEPWAETAQKFQLTLTLRSLAL